MLARTNRLLTAEDFRAVLRRGRRDAHDTMVVSTVSTTAGEPARFGFVVTKKVGNAVSRNLVRRRLKAVARELVDGGLTGMDVAVRALPASVHADWVTLRHDLATTVKGSERR
ncbi:MAG: ribonuclease P protein component [Terrimesophilobacter sp.]